MDPFLSDSPEDVEKVVRLLRDGNIVALPTETVYGLAGDAFNEKAVTKIFNTKGRPLIDPLIVHIHASEQLSQLADCDITSLHALMDACWPGPLTIILPKKQRVPDLVTAGKETVAVRMPKHPLTRRILKESQLHLAAPSANPFGYVSPTRAGHVRDSFKNRVPFIVDGGPCEKGLESTILNMCAPEAPVIMRPGPFSKELLESILNTSVLTKVEYNDTKSSAGEIAPGNLKKHYSPHTPLTLVDAACNPEHAHQNAAYVSLFREAQLPQIAEQCEHFWLTESLDLADAAHNIFHMIRTLDAKAYEHIYMEKAPNTDIGAAINDRLTRAAAQ